MKSTINLIHICFVAPLLGVIGIINVRGKPLPFWVSVAIILLAFAICGYHISLYIENKKLENELA